jgi:dTDP-4-dehydrorhamnose 3,5-epimerase
MTPTAAPPLAPLPALECRPTAIRSHAIIHSNVGTGRGQIQGVVVKQLQVWPDDRGHFAEIFRDEEEVARSFRILQSSVTMTRPNTIKAFHYHLNQDDIFVPVVGEIRIAAHGYEVLGHRDMTMVYYTDQHYDPKDEFRSAYDDPAIGWRWWGIQHR